MNKDKRIEALTKMNDHLKTQVEYYKSLYEYEKENRSAETEESKQIMEEIAGLDAEYRALVKSMRECEQEYTDTLNELKTIQQLIRDEGIKIPLSVRLKNKMESVIKRDEK